MNFTTGRALIDPTRCIGCGECIEACTMKAIRRLPDGHSFVEPLWCAGCGSCIQLCARHAPGWAPTEAASRPRPAPRPAPACGCGR